MSNEAILEAARTVREPDSGLTAAQLATLHDVTLEGGRLTLRLSIHLEHARHRARLAAALVDALAQLPGVEQAELQWTLQLQSRDIAEGDPVPTAKHVILVMSGKGGVGKSTVATNLALALSQLGGRVGLLDADMYGPSIPTMLGVHGRPMSDGAKIEPLSRFGVKLMSLGFLLEDDKAAVVWRGPMLHAALLQFLQDVAWGELDFLVLDLPPGTGDVALTLSQRLRATGAVIVTTPQEVALQDVYKSVSMCKKLSIRVLGVVENQSWFECEHGTRYELFGRGGGQKVAEHAEAPLLGQVPLVPQVREWGDAGTPVVQASPGSEVAKTFLTIAARVVGIVKDLAPTESLEIDRSGGVNRSLPIAR